VVERTAVNRVVVGSNPTLEELIKYMLIIESKKSVKKL
jgi:hypothetical protein